ncbi:MAG: glucose 1-dehydrogenase, partial [Porticoccaceae bacterium]
RCPPGLRTRSRAEARRSRHFAIGCRRSKPVSQFSPLGAALIARTVCESKLQSHDLMAVKGTSTMKFAGRNAIVTGASRGIGRAVAVELARHGANVGLNFRSNKDEALEVVREIEAAGQKAILLQGDVADQSFVEGMVAQVAEEFGSLNLYVSNAAYSDRERMIDADMEGFRRTIDVSMWGAFYGVRAAAQQMVKQGNGGAITVVSSPHAVIPIPTAMAYNMAKAAIDHMVRTAAIELAEHRVRANLVHPGWIDTPGERKFFSEEDIQKGAARLPWGRMGTSEEIAKAIAFTLSDDADYMTGSTLTVDGGVSLPWWSNRDSGEM